MFSESFLCENRRPHTLVIGGASQSMKVFSTNFSFPTNSQMFSPSKISCCTVTLTTNCKMQNQEYVYSVFKIMCRHYCQEWKIVHFEQSHLLSKHIILNNNYIIPLLYKCALNCYMALLRLSAPWYMYVL